ncbi:hypothetical protein A3K55_02200 [Candidatus Shapirobacteria bacterium RBG_13_44_7]|uniref:Methyltransferase FkbM domain-containing protein n=1 Tax=Candidatus Shapirobacteria bacterium RBG_13_44_7 TaxID=1802149 RepID=A0A1F7SJN9_9BACT|nr:MAG: hypothetical protein A3K55_02200 [Candidatus Shapirobacteria bacterium RBG_13_44_7]
MKLAKTRFGGAVFYYQADDKYIGQRIALGKYEPYLTKLMLGNVGRGETVVDVGANIGYYTVLLGKKAKKVYAFEPEKTSFEILKKNVEVNKLKGVELFGVALGGKKEKKKLEKSKDNFGDNRLSDKGGVVGVERLDDLVKEKIGLIKIDTQGWEPEVIKGAREIIRKYHPKIFLEYSPSMYTAAGMDYREMWQFLEEEYGKIFYIDEYIQIYFPIKNCEKECNLWVGKEKSFGNRDKDFWLKKWLKRKLGRPAT